MYFIVGNCWFIAGAAVVATNKKLLARVVPQDQGFGEDYAGRTLSKLAN